MQDGGGAKIVMVLDAGPFRRGAADAKKAAESIDEELKNLRRRVKDAEDALGAGGEGSKDFARQLGKLGTAIDELTAETRQNTAALRDQTDQLRSGEEAADRYAAAGRGIRDAWHGIQAIIRGACAALGAMTERESAMIGLAKTTNLTAEELRGLEERFVALSAIEGDLPVRTEELIDLAAAAGQLGVEGAQNLALYAETIAELAASTDLVGPKAAMILTRILSVQGEGPERIEALASSLVRLGNTSAATERQIATVANRVALTTAQFRIGAVDVAGIATALAESGIQARLGGTQIGKAMRIISEGVAEGGESLERLAALAGQTSDQMVAAWSEDKTGVLIEVLRGMGREGENLGPILREIGLGGQEAAAVFPTIAKNVDRFADRVAVARQEAEDLTALAAESAAAFGTFGSQVTRAQNTLRQIGVIIGRELAPVIDELIDELIALVRENEDVIRSVGRDLAGGARVAGAALAFLVDHLDLVSAAARTLIAIKVAQWISGTAAAIPSAVAGLRDWAASSASAASGTQAFLRVGLTPLSVGLAGVLAGVLAATDAIRKWRDELAEAIEAEVEGARAFSDSIEEIRSSAARLLDAAAEEAEALEAIRRAAVDPASAQAEAIRQQTSLKFHQERIDLLREQRAALADAEAEEEDYRRQLAEVARQTEAWSQKLKAAGHHMDDVRAAAKGLDEWKDAGREVERQLADANVRGNHLRKTIEALEKATEGYVVPTREAATVIVELGDGMDDAAGAADHHAEAAGKLARKLEDQAKAAESAAKATGRDLDRAMEDVAETIRDTLGPELSGGQRRVEEWRQAMDEAATAIAEQRAAIQAAADAHVAAAQTAMSAAETEGQRAEIVAQLGEQLAALGGQVTALAGAEAQLAQARSQSGAVEAELTAADLERTAAIEDEIAAMDRYARAVSQGAEAVSELEEEERRAAAHARVLEDALEATGGDLNRAAGLADEYVAALDAVTDAEDRVAEKADRLGRVVDALDAIGRALSEIETGSRDADAALSGLGAGLQQYAAGLRAGQGRGQAAAGGAMSGITGLALSFNRSGETTQFGGTRGGTYARQGAEIGAIAGPIGAFAGMVIGGLFQFTGDRMVVAMEESGDQVRARIVQAEGGLKDVASYVAETVGGLFEMIGVLTGAEINAALGGLQIAIEDDIVTVNVAGLVAGFRDLSEALAWGAGHVLAMNAEAEGLGENVRRLFETLGRPIAEAGVEQLAAGIELAQMMDDMATGRVPALAQAWRLLRGELDQNRETADLFNLSMKSVVEVHRERIRQATAEIEQQRAMLFGARDATGGYLALIDAMREQGIAMGEEEEATRARIAAIEAMIAAEEAAAAGAATVTEGAVTTTSAVTALAAGMVRTGRTVDDTGGKIMDKTVGMTDGIGTLSDAIGEAGLEALERVQDFGQLQEELAALKDHLADLPAAFDEADLAETVRIAGAAAGDALLQMVRQIRGAQFGAEQERLFAAIQYAGALSQQIQLTQAFLETTDALDSTMRAALNRLIADAQAALRDVVTGRIAVPTGGGAAAGAGRQFRDAQRAWVEMATATREAASGVTDSMFDLRDRLAEVAEAAKEGGRLRIAAEAVGAFVANALGIVEADFMAPFVEAVRRAGETAVETEERLIAERRAAALAQARMIAEAQAAAGLGDVEEIFARMAAAINAALDLELAEAHRQAAEDATAAERDRIAAIEDAAEAVRAEAEERRRALQDLARAVRQQQDIAEATAPAIIALREIEERFAELASDGRELITTTAELDRHLAALAVAEQGVVDAQAISALGDITGFLTQAGAALDPQQAALYAQAMFETSRAQALAVLSQERYRESLIAAGVDLEHWISLLTDLEFPGLDDAAGPARPLGRPRGWIDRMQGFRAPGARPAGDGVDELARLREAMAQVIAGWQQVSDPVLRALQAVTEQVEDFRAKIIDAGGSVADLADLEAAAAAERAEIIHDHFGQLEDRLREIALGDIRQAPVDRLRAMFGELERVAAAVRAGEIGRLGEAIDLERAIRSMLGEVTDPAVGIGAVMGDQLTAILESLRLARDEAIAGGIDPTMFAGGEQAALQVALANVAGSVDASGAISREILAAQVRRVEQGDLIIGGLEQIRSLAAAQVGYLGSVVSGVNLLRDQSRAMATSAAVTLATVGRLEGIAIAQAATAAQSAGYLATIAAGSVGIPGPEVV